MAELLSWSTKLSIGSIPPPRQPQRQRTVVQAKHAAASLAPAAPAPDELGCSHFAECSGCSIQHNLHDPPLLREAQSLFEAHGCPGPLAVTRLRPTGWRCRAKLAVRGRVGAPLLGLFREGSHDVVAIPECRVHHPRINEAAALVARVMAALRIAPYSEPPGAVASAQQKRRQQQQQQQQQRRHRDGGTAQSEGGGLRYLQLTALPSTPGGCAEEDAAAQIQLVLVWASEQTHASAADARALAAALWAEGGGGRQAAGGPLAALRARRAAAAAGTDGPRASSQQQKQQKQQQQPPPLLHSVWLSWHPTPSSNSVMGHSLPSLAHGPTWGWQQFGGVTVALPPLGFVQANYGAFQACLSALVAALPPGGCRHLVELYAGSGTMGLALAAAGAAGAVTCVEVNPDSGAAYAATHAALMAQRPDVAARVCHHVASAGDVAALTAALSGAQDADVLLVDPPRRGLDAPVLSLLVSSSSTATAGAAGAVPPLQPLSRVQMLLYVSCGFPALAADAAALCAGGWRLTRGQAFVFFPGSDALETLAIFERQ